MLMLVFGAGASYDSAPSLRPEKISTPSRPPLAVHLFDNRDYFSKYAARYRRMLSIVPELRNTHGVPIEAVLERLRDESKTFPDGQRQLAAVRYYLREIISDSTSQWLRAASGVTNYRSLLNQIERQQLGRNEQILLVTFNYDTLLEDALNDKGFRHNKAEDYLTSHPRYKLFKLHGSIDWSRKVLSPVANDETPHHLIDRFPDLKLGDTFIVNPERADHKTIEAGLYQEFHALFPAIAIPVQRKD